MRVITGIAKGRRLNAPPGLSTRPTLEHVKEAVFSIIQFEIEGARVLDLFAGSGQMGIEALSRGARSCVFVDRGKECRDIIQENLEHTGLRQNAQIAVTDAYAYLQGAKGSFDIVFIDPPHQKINYEKLILPLSNIISENGVVILESQKTDELPASCGTLLKHREYRYGKTKITVYRPGLEDENGKGDLPG